MWPGAMDDAAEELIAAAGDLIAAEDYLRALEEEMPAEDGHGQPCVVLGPDRGPVEMIIGIIARAARSGYQPGPPPARRKRN